MTDAGDLAETYVAALQHDLADLPPETTKVGVVRRPTRWFNAVIDENYPSLGPPPGLLDEVDERREDLKIRGLCEEEAHNAAWDDVGFETEYAEYLDRSDEAGRALDDLVERLRDGEHLALVCYENTAKKRCHRTLLVNRLRKRVEP